MNNKYKVLAVDCDGTILKDDHTMSNLTKTSLQTLARKNVKVVVATGRPIMGVEFIADIFNDDLPFITYNGAKIVLSKSKTVLFEETLDSYSTNYIIDYAIKLKIPFVIWSQDKLFVTIYEESIKLYEQISGVKAEVIDDPYKLASIGVDKILWYCKVNSLKNVFNEIKCALPNVNMESSTDFFMEFFSSKASKGNALEFICNYYNISLDESIAIGDNYNDISMIKRAGIGVAMDNSPIEVKNNAKYITTSNNDDGVKKFIDNFFK